MFMQLTFLLTENCGLFRIRMDKLEKYYDKVVSADVYLKLEKTSDKRIRLQKVVFLGDDFVVKNNVKLLKRLNYRQNLWRDCC
jgi:formate-dependent nitrite reductase cytochrome c552 subunit